ncbi:hypothetical protein H6G33_09455 [Calothrix sp. FACHB-1219]|uniref:hypothetical protein n=1 Tax=unclassified Calothrix TaxID=2619626 RepID=UPI0016869FE7|nr:MULTISPECIES: hypothetical protein [unclassified Calothrix]MBD2201572.1 hypothetical protein [Calothrix sp. FACHB-168]MBD2217258.1 hypothetical protein [Calothrix sp. FACHB-1219]
MEDFNFYAINLLVELAYTKNIDAVDLFIESISQVTQEKQMHFILGEAADYLNTNNPDLCIWLVDTINDIGADDIEYFPSFKDLEHVLLDEGLKEGIDYTISNEVIHLNNTAKEKLSNYYDMESFE